MLISSKEKCYFYDLHEVKRGAACRPGTAIFIHGTAQYSYALPVATLGMTIWAVMNAITAGYSGGAKHLEITKKDNS